MLRGTTYTKEELDAIFEERGCVFIGPYQGARKPVRYIAKCGHETTSCNINAFMRPKSSCLCKECSPKKTYTAEQVKETIEREGCELLELRHEGKYKVIRILPLCGHPCELKFEKFCAGEGRVCPRCARPRGIKHFAYNPNKTDEERLLDRDVSQVPIWRKAVFTRDEYTCTICKSVRGGNLAAHHLNAWSSFPEQRFLVENGVTLCSNCHLTFHKKYGFGGNTKEQFMEFLRDNTEVINSVTSVDTVEHRS